MPKKVPQLRPILVTFSKMWPILVSFFEFVSDFGLAPETFFGHGFGQKIQIFSKLRQFFFEIHGFLLRGWLGCLAELAELVGWAEERKRKEGKGGGRRRKGEGRRTKEEEGGRGRKEEKEGRKEEVATLCVSVFGCAGVTIFGSIVRPVLVLFWCNET